MIIKYDAPFTEGVRVHAPQAPARVRRLWCGWGCVCVGWLAPLCVSNPCMAACQGVTRGSDKHTHEHGHSVSKLDLWVVTLSLKITDTLPLHPITTPHKQEAQHRCRAPGEEKSVIEENRGTNLVNHSQNYLCRFPVLFVMIL